MKEIIHLKETVDPESFFSNLPQDCSWIADPSLGVVYIFDSFDEEIDETILSHKDKKMDLIYLRMAEVWATNSYCERMKVGSLIVKNKSIIADGYNGSPTGFSNICEDDDNVTLPYVLHAEANAITKLAKSTQSSDGSTLYVTVSPCFECSKLIIQSGVKKLVFKDLYRKLDSIRFLYDAGIQIVRIKK